MRIFIVLIFLVIGFTAKAQDIPLFSQKLTNSFIYNPAMAGIGLGSLTYSYRNNYSGVNGAPTNNFLSLHTPFANYRFGMGVNLFQENVSTVKSTYASAAFAYHINFNKLSSLSFGVSGEYNTSRLSDEAIAQNDGTDLILNRYSSGVTKPDFSFGVNYRNPFLKVGLSANRLYTAWIEPDSTKSLANYYSGFAQGMIPLGDGRSLIEPYFAFRKFSESSSGIDVGVFYTYDNKITAGIATRSGNILNGTLGYRLTKNVLVGYAREMILGASGGYVGSSNEFVLRLDFADRADKKEFKADSKDAMNFRKKSVTKASVSNSSKKSAGNRNPKQLHKSQKKLAPYSPNKRYQSARKVSHGKKMKTSGGKKFKKSYKKSPGSKKYNSKKRKPKSTLKNRSKYKPANRKRR